ncbi:PLAT/LH2 domain [Trinorchestia longiramus]|nr:PLAT/LH2 domain [Trinorchestia longiramus]
MGSVFSANVRRDSPTGDASANHEEAIIVRDPSGDQISEGTRTPGSNSSLTPRSSPRSSPLPERKMSGALFLRPSPSPSQSRSPSPSRKMVSGEGRRKSSAADAMKARILVKTGDQEKSGTDANVYIELEDNNGLKTGNIKLDNPFYDDLERGKLDTYHLPLPEGFGRVVRLYMRRDRKGMLDGWFCDYIIVQDPRFAHFKKHRKLDKNKLLAPGTVLCDDDGVAPKAEYYFPVHRWVNHTHQYVFEEFACCLPQDDPCSDLRRLDLEEKRRFYQYAIRIPDGPVQVESLPGDEKFSDEYFWTFTKEKGRLLAQTTFIQWSTTKWNSFENFRKVFKKFKQNLGEPKCVDVWKQDTWFGLQRVAGTNSVVIKLCTTLPDKLDVTNETVSEFLEGLTLDEALEQKKIFMCDLEILEGLPCKDNRILSAPIALFYLDKTNHLMPIAIQLMQQKGPSNPVYTPADPPNTWLLAKMFYNNAEAQHHQGSTHLGLTHILMEGMCVCTHRNLSPSHPLFKLLAPHFLFLLAINSRGLEKLVSIGGWVDCCMTQGVTGILALIARSVKSWRADLHGIPQEEMKARGVLDPNVLPFYPYRDDAVSLHYAIEKYVTKVLNHHYDTPEKVREDTELQQWRRELVTPTSEGGVGIKGVLGDDEVGFTDVSEVIPITTTIIATCSLGHAAANFQQYDQYAFVPNYPGILMGNPPTEKKEYTDQDLLMLLPNKCMTLDIVLITKLLSKRGTNSLGDFEMQYMYDPHGVQAAKELENDLAKLSLEVKMRNLDRELKYEWLDPAHVPNAISV